MKKQWIIVLATMAMVPLSGCLPDEMVNEKIEKNDSYQLSDVEQHRYLMNIVEEAIQEGRSVLKDRDTLTVEEINQLDKSIKKAETELNSLIMIETPKEIELEFKTWEDERRTELNWLNHYRIGYQEQKPEAIQMAKHLEKEELNGVY